MIKKGLSILTLFILVCVTICGCGTSSDVDYSNKSNWTYYEKSDTDTKADVFFVAPTVYSGDDENFNMSLTDKETKANFLGATNMEKEIYSEDCRFFAPYYKQVGLNVYKLDDEKQDEYLSLAYADVKNAFKYYMDNENNGRPIILAGFSQGADMCIRLLKDCFEDNTDLLVACYAIGWRITEEEVEEYPHIKVATNEKDTGVVVSFNSEAENIDDSLMIPKGTKTLSINPLNWRTDGKKADKSLNKGACFTDYDGNIISEIKNLTGAYIDSSRGSLKVTDVTPKDYSAGIDLFEDGIYHLYDYQFFYRNLQENVATRLNAYLTK